MNLLLASLLNAMYTHMTYQPSKCNHQRIVFQEAMYQSTENENIDITLDLRNFGVPWALHCWIRTLLTAHNNGFGSIIDELLQASIF